MEHQSDPASAGTHRQHNHTHRNLRRDIQAHAESRGEHVGVRHHVDTGRHPGRRLGRGQDSLPRFAITLNDEGAQRLVTTDEVADGLPQSGHIEHIHVENDRNVVGGRIRDEVLLQPEPPLRPRRGQHAIGRSLHLADQFRGGLAARETRPRPRHWVGEHVTDGNREPRLTQPGHQPDGEQRMPTQFEEVVVNTHVVDTEHRCQGRAGLLLGRCGWRTLGPCRDDGSRQRRAVDLAVAGQRQGVQHHDVVGHGLLRQPARQGTSRSHGIDGTDHVTHQHRVGPEVATHHRRSRCDSR